MSISTVSILCMILQALHNYHALAYSKYFFLAVSSVVAQTCPSYTAGYTGTHSDSLHDSSSERIYVNEASAHRAPCDGTVYAWHYCYYDAKRTTNLEVAFGAYRAVLDEGEVDRYTLRSGSYYRLHLDSRETSFTCDNITLEESEYFQIYQDDRVGACLKDYSNVQFLDILAEDAPDDFIVGRSNSGSGRCRESDMSDLSDLSSAASGMVLHLYVDISEFMLPKLIGLSYTFLYVLNNNYIFSFFKMLMSVSWTKIIVMKLLPRVLTLLGERTVLPVPV